MPTVLVVDDDEDIRHSLKMLLTDEGYSVLTASDGIAALQILRQSQQPLLILLDVMMPRLDGPGVLQAVHSDPAMSSRHRFIVMTAGERTLPLAFVRLMKEDSVFFITKPFDLNALLTILERMTKGNQ